MESWVQYVIGPVVLLVIGWVLDRRVRRVDKKASGAAGAAAVAAAGVSEVREQVASTKEAVTTTAADVSEVKEHVVNTHSTILRDDVDGIRDSVSDLADLVRVVHRDFRDFRGEMLDFRAATDANHENAHRRMDVITERLDRHIDQRRFRRRR